jgi:hypothetical protein
MPRVEKVLADQGDRGKRPQQIGQFYQVDFELTTKLGTFSSYPLSASLTTLSPVDFYHVYDKNTQLRY